MIDASVSAINFETRPSEYRHWKLRVDGERADLTLDVDRFGGLDPAIELKGNSYDLSVDIDGKVAQLNGNRVHLTTKEYEILELLCLRKGSTITKEMFLNQLYGGLDEPEIKIIDVFMCKLRSKLAEASGGKEYIETIWGRGYTLRESNETQIRLSA